MEDECGKRAAGIEEMRRAQVKAGSKVSVHIKNETGRGVQLRFYYPKEKLGAAYDDLGGGSDESKSKVTPSKPVRHRTTEEVEDMTVVDMSCIPKLVELKRTLAPRFTLVEWMWWPKDMKTWNPRRWKPKQTFQVSPNQTYFVFQFADPDDDEVTNYGVL